jgi:DNA-binding response OmpR family regulator
VLVVGHESALDQEDGAAALLRQLGAHVRSIDYWGDHARVCDDGTPCRAVVVEADGRPDIAVAVLRSLRKHAAFAAAPAVVAVAERQVTGVEPSGGFDDFLVLPYSAAELYARIRQLEWRRSEFATEERLKMGTLVIDRPAHEVTVDGRAVALTAKEFALLAFLAANRGKVFGRDALLARVWGVRYDGGPRTVDIHVRRLRAKLGDALPLETLRGAGYKLRSFSEAAPSAGAPAEDRDESADADADADDDDDGLAKASARRETGGLQARRFARSAKSR